MNAMKMMKKKKTNTISELKEKRSETSTPFPSKSPASPSINDNPEDLVNTLSLSPYLFLSLEIWPNRKIYHGYAQIIFRDFSPKKLLNFRRGIFVSWKIRIVEARTEKRSSKAEEAAEGNMGHSETDRQTAEASPGPLQSGHRPNQDVGRGPSPDAEMGPGPRTGRPLLAGRLAALHHSGAAPVAWPGRSGAAPLSTHQRYSDRGGCHRWGDDGDPIKFRPSSSLRPCAWCLWTTRNPIRIQEDPSGHHQGPKPKVLITSLN